jgi:uncharacterized membrane protein
MMTATQTETLIDDYLKRLEKLLTPLPKEQRQHLVSEIAEHIATARSQQESQTDSDIRAMLNRIGRPEDIAAEAMGGEQPVPTARGWVARLGLILLPVAGVLIVLELICGVAGVVHYLSVAGISAKRRRWTTGFFIVIGAIGPIAAALILLDLVRTRMTWTSRLALVGYLGSVVGGVAVLLFLPFVIDHDILLGFRQLHATGIYRLASAI